MITLRIVWRPGAFSSFYVQDWQGSSRKAALARWSRYWGLRQRDCFEITITTV